VKWIIWRTEYYLGKLNVLKKMHDFMALKISLCISVAEKQTQSQIQDSGERTGPEVFNCLNYCFPT
jgi:hypothetical protein